MGPIALFDKSFLQSLNLNESVWFDHFFLANVCPIFYVETQADLAKEECWSTPEELVRGIAAKFPAWSGAPNAYHSVMCTGNLLGHEVPLIPQVVLAPGCRANVEGHIVDVLPESRETQAFIRWSQGDFKEEERQAAAVWRQMGYGHPTEKVMGLLKDQYGYKDSSPRNLSAVRDAASQFINTLAPLQQLMLGLCVLGIEQDQSESIIKRFIDAGQPGLGYFAPYADFALRVELTYHIGVHKSFLHVVHRMDMTYLFYLPFCQFFVSTDNVHKDCAPLFLREDQEFVWGKDLKVSLKALNDRYSALPEKERKKSIHEFAPYPPMDEDNLVTTLWDKHWPGWKTKVKAERGKDAVEWLNKQMPVIAKIPEAGGDKELSRDLPADVIARKRRVSVRKGSWWLVPESHRKKKPPTTTFPEQLSTGWHLVRVDGVYVCPNCDRRECDPVVLAQPCDCRSNR